MKRFYENFPYISRPDSTPKNSHRSPTDDQWDFYLASVFGDIPTLKRVLSESSDIDGTIFYDFPLLMAVRQGRVETVRFLLDATGGRIDDRLPKDTVWFSRCIETAEARGFVEIREMLVEQNDKAEEFAPPDIARLDEALRGPLAAGDLFVAEEIIKAKPKILRVSRYQQQDILDWAYGAAVDVDRRIELLRLLFDNGLDPNDAPLIHHAAEANDLPMASFLLEEGADPNTVVDSCSNCMWIARFTNPDGYHQMHKLLQRYGGRMPLHNEFEDPSYEDLLAGDQETLEIVNNSGELLSGIIHNDDVELLDRYVELMGNDRIKLVAPNRGAYIPRSLVMLDRLVEHGMNINQRDWRGQTMLFAGTSVQWLAHCLHHGADVDAVEFVDCSTRLGLDVKDNNLEMVKFLLENDANPNLPMEHKWAQPLTIAERQDNAEIANLLHTD